MIKNSNILSGDEENVDGLLGEMNVNSLIYIISRYTPITFVQVERSFSSCKNMLTRSNWRTQANVLPYSAIILTVKLLRKLLKMMY